MRVNPKRTSAKAVKKAIAKEQAAQAAQAAKVAAVEQVTQDKVENAALPIVTPTNPVPTLFNGNVGRDILTTSVETWNSKDTTPIDLRSNRCALHVWDVRPEPLYLPGNVPSGLSMLVCTDDGKPMGTEDGGGRLAFNPKTYHVFTNDEMLSCIELILAALDKLGVKYQVATTGSVANRNKTFVSIRILDNAKFVIDGREFLEFLDILNSFNKSCNITFTNSNVCVCCANTCRMALQDEKGAFKVSIPHRKNAKAVIKDVPKLIAAAFSGKENFAKSLKHFSEFGVKLEQAEQIFASFIGLDGTGNNGELSTRSANMVETMKNLFRNGKGNKGQTALDVFQAATEYYTHYSAGKSDDAMKQFESSEFGTAARDKVAFFQMLVGATESQQKFDGVARIGETILIAYNKAKIDKAKAKE